MIRPEDPLESFCLDRSSDSVNSAAPDSNVGLIIRIARPVDDRTIFYQYIEIFNHDLSTPGIQGRSNFCPTSSGVIEENRKAQLSPLMPVGPCIFQIRFKELSSYHKKMSRFLSVPKGLPKCGFLPIADEWDPRQWLKKRGEKGTSITIGSKAVMAGCLYAPQLWR